MTAHERGPGTPDGWYQTWRADPELARLADRHYSRQTPGTRQFTPPGRVLVLRTATADAGWATSWPFAQYVNRAWKGAWLNSFFRNEGPQLSSDLIIQAVAATRWYWPQVPAEGMITMIDTRKIRRARFYFPRFGRYATGLRYLDLLPGHCYRKAGWIEVGKTKGGLTVLQILEADMPPACAPCGAQLRLEDAA